MRTRVFFSTSLFLLFLAGLPASAGFTGTDLVIVATARVQGGGDPPAQFYSTLWISNPAAATSANVELQFLRHEQTNPNPRVEKVTVKPRETAKYENVLETVFHESGSGAIRILSNTPVLVSSRTYDKPVGANMRDSKGLFFPAIPVSFAISRGESANLQGISQGGEEDFRYNFGFLETAGKPVKVRATLFSDTGNVLGSKTYELGGYEARQYKISDLDNNVATSNARIEAVVTEGDGAVFLYGTLVANGSQDSIGFEMSFKDGLLNETASRTSEVLSGNVSSTVPAVARKCHEIAPKLGVTSRRYETKSGDYTASYDPATGFWTVSLTLETGQTAQFQMQFQDASGTPMKLYNPLQTDRMVAIGSASGSLGSADFNLTLSGAKASSLSLTVNGSGTCLYQGVSGSYDVLNVVQPKVLNAYPTSGTIKAVASGITVTVTFNGTQFATGTYSYRNRSYTFTINLETGEVVMG